MLLARSTIAGPRAELAATSSSAACTTAAPRWPTAGLHACCPARRVASWGRRATRLQAAAGDTASALNIESTTYEHILVALCDESPYLSDSSRQAVAAAAGLARTHSSKVTVLFVDEAGKQPEGKARIEQIETALQSVGCNKFEFVERESEATQGKESVAVGDVADQVDADLLIMSTEAVHSRKVDANLLAEFVPCPILLLP